MDSSRRAGRGSAAFITLAAAPAAGTSPEAVRFFETKIRPLLAERCYGCHGPANRRGGLRLDSAAAFHKGGDSGPLVQSPDPDRSLLLQVLRYDGPVKMPPQGQLSRAQFDDVTTWVKAGAPWPESRPPLTPPKLGGQGGATPNPQSAIRNPQSNHWAFQPLRLPKLPALKSAAAPANPIDAFIRAKLEARGLDASPPADPRTLIRRVTYDLTGLPPTPEEVDAFVRESESERPKLSPRTDKSGHIRTSVTSPTPYTLHPTPYTRLVDRLLASPAYGERWGRHWLDVVRYAQSNGYERDDEKPNAWRYRDYVIRSFNQDKPYDQFVREQLAGDELETVTDDSLTATAFYRLGVWDDEPDDARQAEFDNLDDMLSTTGTAFLGLTIGCARCHDHKFDPIPQADYYGMLAFLRNVHKYEKPEQDSGKWIFANLKAGGQTLAVREDGPAAPKTHVLIRGSASTPAAEVQPHFVAVLCPTPESATPAIPAAPAGAATCGRRRVLANWIASPENPLTARVMVNRVWQHLFGRGLVATPNDFGHTGLPPTHPELLDYLAHRFSQPASSLGNEGEKERGRDRATETPDGLGWSLKALIRQVVLSATYRQSSALPQSASSASSAVSSRPNPQSVDPGNSLLWRQSMRRLEAEAIRDAILATTGKLNREMGGRGIFPLLSAEVLSTQSRPGNGWGQSSEAERCRRSVYIFMKRTLGVPFLETFDAPTPDSPVAARPVTTIAPQALILLNSQFMDEQSAAFAERLVKETGPDPERSVERAYRLALGRAPSAREKQVALAYLDRRRAECGPMAPDEAYRSALRAFCKIVLNLNEFVYVD